MLIETGGHAEPVIGPAHRVRPLAGPMAGSSGTWWLCPLYVTLPAWPIFD
jgi:hypothetical protein